MATVKRFNKLLGLEKIDVLIDERDTSRHIIITDMPQSLPQGKSSFLIEVSPYMKEGTELQIDFMDSAGNSIYVEPVQNYLEGSSRTLSVEVYDSTSAGIATIIIVGELDKVPIEPGSYSEVEDVPEEFQGHYNVRLTREVIINTAEINVQPIKFYSSPRLTAFEKRFGTMEREVVSEPTVSDAFAVKGAPINQQQFEIFQQVINDDSGQGAGTDETTESQPQSPPAGDTKGDEAEKEKLKRHSKKRSVRGDSRGKRSKRIRRRNSPVEFPYSFTINDDAHTFTTEEIGGEIRFSAIDTSIYNQDDLENNEIYDLPTFNVVTDPNDANFPNHYTASIADLNNSITAYTNTPFTKQDIEGNYRILEMSATGKVHYTKEPSASYSLNNIVSYADITISHLRTFSGELFKAKVYVRSEGSFDDYKLLAEVPIESPELMINNNSVGIGERSGYFISDPDVNTYWDLFGSTNGLTAASSTSTASYDNDTMIDSVMVSGSTSVFTDQLRFQTKEVYKFNLTRSIDYTLSFNTIGQKDTDGRALMLVYISGSSMKQSDNLYNDEITDIDIEESSTYGKRMGVLEVEPDEDNKKDFKIVSHNFNTNLTGDATVQFRIVSGQWNLSDISVLPATDTGFSPSFVNFQQELPVELTHKRPDDLDFLVEFYDVNNNIADEVAVANAIRFSGANMVITGDDNNMSGDLFIGGDSTASGMHFGGVDSTIPETGEDGADGSGFMRSVGYLGFTSASDSSLGGTPGFMIYSGSVLPGSGENYAGVGLELVGVSGSLKFRTNPSLFDVQADSFFVGKTNTQFISGSGQKIEISSSNFHLQPGGDVDMTGTITAAAGAIGGWEIKDGDLRAGAGNSSVTMSGDDQLIRMGSGSTFTADEIDGVLFGKDTDGKYKFGIGSGGSYIFFDGDVVNIKSEDINVTASVFSVDVDQFKLSATNLFISSSQGGFISLGNPRPSGIDGTNKGIFIKGKGSDDKPKFLAGDAAGGHLSFDGDNVFMSSSAFFLGSPTQFVSGSLGNIEISSSNFHLDNAGNVIMSGKVTAAEGEIGGLTIGSTKLSSGTAYEISSSTNVNDPVSFISSSGFKVSAGGQVTASGLSLQGGDVGGLSVSEGTISVGDILKLKDSGQITGSKVLFTGGTIGGFTIDADEIKSTNVLIDSANEKITLGSGNAIKLQGGATDNFLTMGSKGGFGDEGTGTAGILIGMDATNPQAEFVKDSSNYFIFDDGIDIQTDTLKASGSSIILEAPKFFLGKKTSTFVSGSNGSIEISSSAFHLTPEGNITASNILLGDKGGTQFLQFADGALTVRGDLAVDSLFLPATIAGATSTILNASSSLNSTGFAKFVSASIGGFVVDSSQINSANNNIVLEADGGATISGSSINLQTPKFYFGESDNFISGSEGNIKIFSTGDTTLSGSSITLSTPKFFMGESSQFISGSNGNIEISSSKFHLKPDGDIIVRKVNADEGEIGGFEVGSSQISSSTGGLILKSDGQITGSKFLLSGGRITSDVTIEGSLAANSISTPADGTKLAEITDAGFARFVSASIGGFDVNTTEIRDVAGNLRLKSGGQITASAAQITGKITAESGAIGGFTINSSTITATNFTLDPANKSITIGTGTNIFIADGDVGIHLGHGTFSSAPFSVTKAGVLKSTSGTIGGWVLSANRFNDSGDTVRIDSNAGSISIKNHTFGQAGIQLEHNSGTSRFYVGDGSNKHLKFDGSDVDIKSAKFELDASNVEISSTHASMSLGEGKIRLIGASTSTMTLGTGVASVTMSADGTDTFIAMGDKTDFSSQGSGTAGILIGMDNDNPQAEFVKSSTNYFIFDDGIDIKTDTFNLDTTNLDINSATKRIEVSDGSATRVRIGEVDSTSANHFGIVVYDGNGTAAADEIVHLSDAKYQIASWSLSPTQISSENLIIDSAGILQTSDFASGVKGWRISSADNGSAEFENISVRGTLKTTVFEKETVNAVGGQLYIANSTVTTGSVALAATATTMSVVNVSGFAADEILAAKKIGSTGFATEYMKVVSSSRDVPSSNTNFAGNLFLIRGYRSGSLGESGSLGDRSNLSQSYEPGQVVISTGKIGTGFIRLNANPNDQTTPYMDIVERTGSGVYDVELKARLGDLSGLSSGLLYGNATPGFGLFTENVFLSGAITAQTGSIEGILHVRTDLLNQITLGTNVKNSLDGIHINDNNFWYTNGHFRTGFDGDNFIHQSGSALTIKTATFDLDATTIIIDSANNDGSIRLGGSGGPDGPTVNTAGIYMDGGGAINVFGNTTNLLRMDGAGTLTMKSDEFNLETSTIKIDSTTNSGKIALGATAPTTISGSNTGVYLDGKGNFRAGKPGHGRIEWDGTDVYVSSSAFFLGSESQFMSGSNGNIEISSSDFHLKPDGNVVMSGKVTAAEGNIGGFEIGSSQISSSTGGLILNADGGITGSAFRLEGGVITADVSILGSLSANSISTPADGTKLAEITDAGFARFVSASIGGFDVNDSQINSTNDALILKSNGQITASAAKISGNITITGGDLAGVSAATISGSVSEVSASLALASASMATQVSLTSTGMSLNKANGSSLANYGATTRIGLAADARTEITSTAISMYSGKVSGTSYKRVAIDNTGKIAIGGAAGADVAIDSTDDAIRIVPGTGITIFDSDADKLLLSSDGMTLTENSQVRAIFGAVTAIGSAGAAVTTTSTDDVIRIADGTVSIFKQDTEKAILNGDGLSIYDGSRSAPVAVFGATAYVGLQANEHIKITNSSMELKDNNTVLASFGATTTIGETDASHVSMDSDSIDIKIGAVTFLSASAAGLEMSGSIRASGGEIGGFTIGTNKIESLIGGSSTAITVTANGSSNYIIESSAQPALTFVVGNTYVFTMTSSVMSSHPFRIGTSANGSVITDGVTVTSTTLTIVVTASTPTSLFYFCTSHSGMGNSISVIKPPLVLDGSNGQITASAVSMSGMINAGSGQIGNFAITSNNLVGGTTFKLDPTTSNGELMLGTGFGPEALDGTDPGLYVNGDGDFNLVIDASNRIHNDGGFTILSEKFDLDAGTIILDSGTNSGKLAIGGTPPTAYNTGVGVYFDGTGKALIGNSTGSRIQYDGDGTLIMSASNFFLGGGGQFVSGSNGNIEISSSNFHLETNGNVTMSGEITAASGQIATFSITSGSIDSDTSNTKRGLKLEPNVSIRGYGDTVHTTETAAGKFSFSVGSVSPSATADVPFNSNYSAPPGGVTD